MTGQIKKRSRALNQVKYEGGPVLYWMDRDMRIKDNWALLAAVEIAKEKSEGVHIIYNLVPNFLGGTTRQLQFKCEGLQEIQDQAEALNIPFHVTTKEGAEGIEEYIRENRIGLVVTDFSPLRIQREWKEKLAKGSVPLLEVDTHNIIPVWETSDKREFAAYTIRPKIHKKLAEYLVEIPQITKQEPGETAEKQDIDALFKRECTNIKKVPAASWKGGESNAQSVLKQFLEKLRYYDEDRNNPLKDGISNLSPYLHYGMISPQRVALEAEMYGQIRDINTESFIEELVVRRELAENFCYYCKGYDTYSAAPDWAKKTLEEHRDDPREYIYSQDEFEQAITHDQLWNAAQRELLQTGKMHGYMRMYWAKKIMQWTPSVEDALKIAIYLNDTYELDGRDPNGYTGIAWSMFGLHDRAWQIREVFGKIRYMNENGCKKRFDMKEYIQKWSGQEKLC